MMETQDYRPKSNVSPTLAEVAQWLGGELREVADPERSITGLATLTEAGPSEISFVAGKKGIDQAMESRAGLLIVSAATDVPGCPRVVVGDVWKAVAELMKRLYAPPAPPPGVHPTALVAQSAKLADGVSVGPYCVIGEECEIGAGTRLGPHCILETGCRLGRDCRLVARVTLACPVVLGDRVLIHPGAVLGADGFKFELVEGRPLKIPQVGTVVIEDDIEIGANTTIDRAFLHVTRIGRGTKIDNLVQVGHNVQVGAGCVMAAQVGIAGSTRVGAGCMIGGGAGIADNLTIGERTLIAAHCGVERDLEGHQTVIGAPCRPIKRFWRLVALQDRLPEMARRLKELERRLEETKQDPPVDSGG